MRISERKLLHRTLLFCRNLLNFMPRYSVGKANLRGVILRIRTGYLRLLSQNMHVGSGRSCATRYRTTIAIALPTSLIWNHWSARVVIKRRNSNCVNNKAMILGYKEQIRRRGTKTSKSKPRDKNKYYSRCKMGGCFELDQRD